MCEDNAPRVLGMFNDIDDALDAFNDDLMTFDTPTSRMFIIELGDPSLRVTWLPPEVLPTESEIAE